jgi:uncharacterized SAM-binding protein YcdF (DUF218 family)
MAGRTDHKNWLRVLRRGVSALLLAVGIVVTVVTFTPVTAWCSRWLSGRYTDPGGQVLVVLGGSYLEPGIIGQDTYWRAVYAVRAYRRWKYPRVILSGAGVSDGMREFLLSMGIPAGAIELESRSHSTRESALYLRQMLGDSPGQAVLMTSDYHMFRASRAFSRAGVRMAPYPVPHAIKLAASWRTRWPAFIEEISESVKTIYYAARGWI